MTARRRTVRRAVIGLVAALFAGGFAATYSGASAVKAFYQGLFPADPAKRQALDLCFQQDHKFNRLDADARGSCYHRMLGTLNALGAVSTDEPAAAADANPVDLRRAAGQGTLPRDDVRRLERNEEAPHAPR